MKTKIDNYGMTIIETEEVGVDDTRTYLENKYKEQIIKGEKKK